MDKEFLGPQSLAQAYRFAVDSRDQGWPERKEVVDSPHGCFRCELAGSCSAVCPKGVDPGMGVQLLKRRVIGHRVRLPADGARGGNEGQRSTRWPPQRCQ